jgi:hypothetical protein
MKRTTLWFFGAFLFMLFTRIALGADASIEATVTADAPSTGEWASFLAAIAGWRGLGTLGLIGLSIQGGMLAIRHFQPKWKLAAVSGGSVFLGVTTLVAQGLDWKMAVLHSSTLAAAQVFGYEVFKTYKKRKPDLIKETMIV